MSDENANTFTLDFNWEVISVNNELNLMEVVYTAQDRQPTVFSMFIPSKDEDLEQIIKQNAPTLQWRRSDDEKHVVSVGQKGTGTLVFPLNKEIENLSNNVTQEEVNTVPSLTLNG